MKIKKFTNGSDIKITTFDSVVEMRKYLDENPIRSEFERRRGGPASIRTASDKTKWCGSKSWNEALGLLTNGWSEKAKELETKMSHRIAQENNTTIRQKSVYDVVGGNCSVPRYLQGVPTSMIRQVRTPVKQKTATLNYNISYNCDVTADEITNNALDCLMEVKRLEDSGTRVNLNVVWVTEKNRQTFAWVIPVKKTSERLSLAKVAFMLCHPSMLRRIAFGLLERETEANSMFVDGYGHSIRDEYTLKDVFPDTKFFN